MVPVSTNTNSELDGSAKSEFAAMFVIILCQKFLRFRIHLIKMGFKNGTMITEKSENPLTHLKIS